MCSPGKQHLPQPIPVVRRIQQFAALYIYDGNQELVARKVQIRVPNIANHEFKHEIRLEIVQIMQGLFTQCTVGLCIDRDTQRLRVWRHVRLPTLVPVR